MKTLKNYKEHFRKYWGFAPDETPMCWSCLRRPGVDIHHLTNKGMGGVSKNRLNRIDNLFPLCRLCHNKAHSDKSLNEDFKKILMAKFKNDRQEKIDFWINSKIGVNQVKKLIGRLDEKYKEHGIDV